jgi:hypothetical protein
MMIKPTIGRVVHYFPSELDVLEGEAMAIYGNAPCTALIAYVWSDICVNLVVFDHTGIAFSRTSVAINVDGSSPHAEWMPYQIGQAAKTEAAEAALAQADMSAKAGAT